MKGLIIRVDLSADQLRALARRERNGRTLIRLLALANALSGMSRAEAAKAAGMDRQTLRDWVHRYNDKGVDGLRDRPKGHPKPKLTEGEGTALANIVFRAPDPDKDGVSTWTTQALADWISERFGKRIELWFMDEARVGQKGRTCHRWWTKGKASPGSVRSTFQMGLHLRCR